MTPRNRLVLLVDDSDDDVELAIRALQRSRVSHTLVVVRDGQEALDYLFGRGAFTGTGVPVPPALILLDLKLPKLDGLEVLRRIRGDAATRSLPVVVLTTSREPTDIGRAYALGANSYIRKPTDFGEFVEVARQLVQYWLVLNEANVGGPTHHSPAG